MADDDDDDDDDGNASRYTEESGIAEIARAVGAMGQKGKVPRRTKAVARKPKPSATTTTAETSAPARLRVMAPESGVESSKAGSMISAPPPASVSAPASDPPAPAAPAARKRRPATKPRKPASASTSKAPSTSVPSAASPPALAAAKMTAAASPHDSSSAPRGRKPRSVSKMADEKMSTDVEGKVRKRRKLAGGGAALREVLEL